MLSHYYFQYLHHNTCTEGDVRLFVRNRALKTFLAVIVGISYLDQHASILGPLVLSRFLTFIRLSKNIFAIIITTELLFSLNDFIISVRVYFFMGLLIPLFCSSGDVSSGFQSQGEQPYLHM